MVAPIPIIIVQKKIDVKNWRQIVEPMTQKRWTAEVLSAQSIPWAWQIKQNRQ